MPNNRINLINETIRMNSKEIMCTKFDTGENKTRLPRLSDSRYSASANANTNVHHFSGIAIDFC